MMHDCRLVLALVSMTPGTLSWYTRGTDFLWLSRLSTSPLQSPSTTLFTLCLMQC
jgi:hypothetical protein